MYRWLLVMLMCGVVACGSKEDDDETTADTMVSTGDVAEDMTAEDTAETSMDMLDGETSEEAAAPRSGAELEPFLTAKGYAEWRAEEAPHDSAGPHFGQVRVFINATLSDAIGRGDATWPEGSAVVKELYGSAGSAEPLGYSYWVKLEADSAGGANIYWYEAYQGSSYADSAGASLCTGCHGGGKDYLLSTSF